AVVSTGALDCYFTRQAESSLANYAADAQGGSPLLACHDGLPVGRSFSGTLAEDGVTVLDYMLRGHSVGGISTDEIARGIEAGTLSDMSIRFGGPDAWYRCGICDKNLFSPECPHVPGVEYDGVRAFAWVEDARMVEHSIVFSGATPGAVIRKARSMARAGRLSSREIGFLEDAWRVRLGEKAAFPVPAEDLRAAGIVDARSLSALVGRASDGEAYRAELLAETLAEGVRALGDAFDSKVWGELLSSRSAVELRRVRDEFRSVARRRFGEPGRRTVPSSVEPGDAVSAFLERTRS
ncbi:MAG: hypothetical protein ACYC08_10170, partial [Armatimonadota bacterium]